ncbi:ribosome-binding factor A, partial [Bifidobacterium mongoliense]
MANPRIARLQDQIRVIVAQMLQSRIKDPRLGFVTITDVRLTGDAREATVFYTVMG